MIRHGPQTWSILSGVGWWASDIFLDSSVELSLSEDEILAAMTAVTPDVQFAENEGNDGSLSRTILRSGESRDLVTMGL
jgi:hypothetical protein